MIAILTNNATRAIDNIRKKGNLEQYSEARRRGTFTSRREFVVVTQKEHLDGIRLSDYILDGYVEQDLVDCARSRMTMF